MPARVPAAIPRGSSPRPFTPGRCRNTLARLRLGRWEDTLDLVLAAGLALQRGAALGVNRFVAWQGDSAWAMAAFLLAWRGPRMAGLAAWLGIEQFRLEETLRLQHHHAETWWLDRLKGLLLAAVLGYPLLVLVLKLVEWTGAVVVALGLGRAAGFQLLMAVLAPVLILPLFNKFTPLPEGSLRERLLELAERTRFRARSIQVMDGSKRSRHSNAFFTGFGRFRKIVLFDTLIQQLAEPELEAVLAHEIGHYKKKHIPKMLLVSAAGLAGGLLADLAGWRGRSGSTGLSALSRGASCRRCCCSGCLAGVVTFWFSPLAHWWSRRHEYQADAFAAEVMGEPRSLIGALRKLNEKNLSNLTPHPLYSGFYYSHPTLLEREAALAGPARCRPDRREAARPQVPGWAAARIRLSAR